MRTSTRRLGPVVAGTVVSGALFFGVSTPAMADEIPVANADLQADPVIFTPQDYPIATLFPMPTGSLPTGTPIAEPGNPTEPGATTEPGLEADPSQTVAPDPIITGEPTPEAEPTVDEPSQTEQPSEAPTSEAPSETGGGVPDEPAVPTPTEAVTPIGDDSNDVDPLVPIEPGYDDNGPAPEGAAPGSNHEPQVPTVPGVTNGDEGAAVKPNLAETGGAGDLVMTLSAGLVLSALGTSLIIRRREQQA